MQGRNCTHIVIQSSVLGDIFIHVAAFNITTYFQWPLNVLTENDFSLKCHLWKLELTVNWVLIFSYSKNIQNPGKSKRGARKMCFLAPGFWPKFPQALYTAYLKKKKIEQTVPCWFWKCLHSILHPPHPWKLSVFL